MRLLIRRFPCAILLLVLALTLCSPGKPAASPPPRAIRSAYASLDAAYDRRDVPSILALYAPEFVRRDAASTQNLAQTRLRLTDDFEGTRSVTARTRLRSLVVHGGHAEAVVRRRVDVTLPKPLSGMPPPYFTIEVEREMWRQTPRGWRLAAMQPTPLQLLLWHLDLRDQTIRRELIADPKNPVLAARMKVVDDADRVQMKQILQRYGWPGYDLVGTTDASIVWEIVQHSDDDRAFQKRCLPLLQAAVRREQASPSELALLTDRILRGDGKPQIYGTQFMADAQGVWVPQPLADPTHVDQRRASVGLGPLAEYTKGIRQIYRPMPKAASPQSTR